MYRAVDYSKNKDERNCCLAYITFVLRKQLSIISTEI